MMIGSMTPDFTYFLPGEPGRMQTHSVAGLFWFCWPVGMAVWMLFVRVLEQPTFALLPEHWRTRFPSSSRDVSLNALMWTSIAVILGAATHIVWDSFTHRGTPVVNSIPALRAVAFHIDGWRIRWFMLLQHASSLAGLALLALWAWRRPPGRYPRTAPCEVSHAMRVRAISVLVAVSLSLAFASYVYHSDTWFLRRLFHFAVGGMTGWMLAWIAIAIFVSRTERRALTAPNPPA